MMRPRLFALGVAVLLATLALDQASKWWVVMRLMNPPRIIPVTSFFDLVMVWNTGVSFGMLGGDVSRAPILAGLALAISAALLVWLARTDRPLVGVAIGLIVGGAIGNAIDRLRFGAVADFIDLYWGHWHWPAFNVADTALTLGVLLIILDSLIGSPRRS